MKQDKVYQYAKKLCSSHTPSTNSQYYMFGELKLRISDHIGKNSDGDVHIVLSEDGSYITYNVNTNKLTVVNYEGVKSIIRGMSSLGGLVAPPTNQKKMVNVTNQFENEKRALSQKLEGQKKHIKFLESRIQHYKSLTVNDENEA